MRMESARDHCEFARLRIPIGMIESHDEQAKKNHCGQDLTVLQRRGGVSPCEALAILDDKPWTKLDQNAAYDELSKRITQYEISNQPSV